MPSFSRVIVGRDNWKQLAVDRRKDAESKSRQASKWKSRFEQTKAELDESKKRIEALESELEKKNSYTSHTN